MCLGQRVTATVNMVLQGEALALRHGVDPQSQSWSSASLESTSSHPQLPCDQRQIRCCCHVDKTPIECLLYVLSAAIT